MAKNREAVTCNGRAAFYAAMWDDIRQCAMDNGWAVALHGSLSSDMDIMAMPWVEDAAPHTMLIKDIAELFTGNEMTAAWRIDYDSKPHGRAVATIPIWADFYLDISIMGPPRSDYHTMTCSTCAHDGIVEACPTPDMECNSCKTPCKCFGCYNFDNWEKRESDGNE